MKIMAIDYGDAHTGIAISDATGTLAGFTTVIDSLQGRRWWYRRSSGCSRSTGSTELVLGYPKNMDGTRGSPLPRRPQAIAEHAAGRRHGLPVTLWDERRTTVDAHNILI